VNYIARGKSEEEQTKFIAPFSDALITPEGGKPIEEDESRRKAVVTDVLVQVTSLGNGTEKGE
jgi:translation initiation factor 3 subunit M